MRTLLPSQRNQTGFGCGVPSALLVVSQITRSSRSRRSTRSPKGVEGEGSTEVISVPLLVFSDRSNCRDRRAVSDHSISYCVRQFWLEALHLIALASTRCPNAQSLRQSAPEAEPALLLPVAAFLPGVSRFPTGSLDT